MSTQDPFQNPSGAAQGGAPVPPPAPEYRVYTYGPGDSAGSTTPTAGGYAAPQSGYSDPTSGYAQPSYPQPGYGQPAYGQPGYPAPGASEPGTDGVSVAALVTGILGTGFVAIILGAIGLKRTAGGVRKGRGMAWAGLVLGILGTIAWTIGTVLVVAAVNSDEFQEGFSEGFNESFEESLNEGLEGTAYSGEGDFSASPTYGDDADLDVLWDQCEAGDNPACDELYEVSELGSGYEAFGDACGGRGRPLTQVWCDPERSVW